MKGNHRRAGELIFPAIAIVASFIYLWEVRDISNPDMNLILVNPLAWSVVLIAAYIAITSYLVKQKSEQLEGPSGPPAESNQGQPGVDSTPDETSFREKLTQRSTRRSLAWIVWFIVYIILLDIVGFNFATPLFIAGIMVIMKVRSPIQLIGVPLIVTVAFHVIFVELLGVRLP